ncbi:HU family DNA-binding protein [uncultured Celeribacter sp.]|uniref:HU family DNA-binding protein n=1 Tax=uncultured Celeribacter sp. TaxID=1303376 RepID=UPI002AA73E01|nr:HU family DNA-binding protein [uncultured Celeribacter sp.]
MANYSKADLIKEVAEDLGFAQVNAKQLVDAVFDKITTHADAGDKVSIAGFGKFEMRDRAARTGRNPRTGDPVDIPASRNLAFKPFKSKS